MNNVNLIGRLTKDVDLRYTQSGLAVGRFSVAIDRPKKDGQSNGADFPNCVAYGKTAENLAQYMHKGGLVGVTGHIQTGSYETKDGRKVYTTDVSVTNVQFLDSRSSNNNGYQQQSTPNLSNNGNFSQNNAQNVQNGFDENDLPF